MKVIYKNQIKKHNNSKVCLAHEYHLGDKDINGAVIEIKGRYPDKDRVVNLKCKELVYILEGSGKVVVDGKTVKFKRGDMILIYAGEKYYWNANCIILTACTPAWYSKQHKIVK
jgi:mannose-6-phosphate isomerase-like protein (cupin superfamily)